MEHIGVSTQRLSDRHEGEHGGRASHRRCQSRDVCVEPNHQHNENGFEDARSAKQVQRFQQKVDNHKDNPDMHPRNAQYMTHPRRSVGGLQFRVQSVVIPQKDGLQYVELIAAHSSRYVDVRQAVARLLRHPFQRVGRRTSKTLPRLSSDESRVVDSTPSHIMLIVKGIRVARRQNSRKMGVHAQQISIAQRFRLFRRLQIEQHLPLNGLTVNILQNLSLHFDALLPRRGFRRDAHHPIRVRLEILLLQQWMEPRVGQEDTC